MMPSTRLIPSGTKNGKIRVACSSFLIIFNSDAIRYAAEKNRYEAFRKGGSIGIRYRIPAQTGNKTICNNRLWTNSLAKNKRKGIKPKKNQQSRFNADGLGVSENKIMIGKKAQ